jgi:hypothetical protein
MMEEIISEEDEHNTHKVIEDSEKSSSSSSSDIVNNKSTDKISHITLLSAVGCAKMKSRTKVEYYDVLEKLGYERRRVQWIFSELEEKRISNKMGLFEVL